MSIIQNCPNGKILNPSTNTFVKMNGKIGKQILHALSIDVLARIERNNNIASTNKVTSVFRNKPFATSMSDERFSSVKIHFGPKPLSLLDLIHSTLVIIHAYGKFPVTNAHMVKITDVKKIDLVMSENYTDHSIGKLSKKIINVWAYFIDQGDDFYDYISIVYNAMTEQKQNVWVNVQIHVSSTTQHVRVTFYDSEPDIDDVCFVEASTDPDSRHFYKEYEQCVTKLLETDEYNL